ncbi:hypothetical protein HYR99_19135 [Candidatus Poribacteria bacterium]|nr:hypothetical protein [Candidatus Poribacteria bacterium]
MKSNLLKSYSIAAAYPDISGFEVLELLDMRSELSQIEDQLTDDEKSTLELADEVLLDGLKSFYERIREIGDLAELRKRAKVPPSHWWWYMDKFVGAE